MVGFARTELVSEQACINTISIGMGVSVADISVELGRCQCVIEQCAMRSLDDEPRNMSPGCSGEGPPAVTALLLAESTAT